MQQTLNYEEELKSLKEKTEYWKPSEGKHSVKLMSEPMDDQYVKEDGTSVQQWKLSVNLLESKDGAGNRVWKFPKSTSPNSLRGQLVKLGSKNKRLADTTITVLVQGKGKERRYTIPEAL